MTIRRSRLVPALVVAVVVIVGAVGTYAWSRASAGGARSALGSPRFVDETASAGVDQTYMGVSDVLVGGGVAVLDCDGDGRPDLFLPGGTRPAALYHNDSPVGGALRFSPRPSPEVTMTGVDGAYPIDVDGDGNVDLVVLRLGGSQVLRGLGGCRFEAETAQLGLADAGWPTAFSATWEGGATLPTLAIGHYLTVDPAGEATLPCGANGLFRPDATGRRYAAPVPLEPAYCALSMLFSDWDRSGRRDLRVSNDRHYYDNQVGRDQLFRISPGEAPRVYTEADGWFPLQVFGMGIASYDVTGDGYPEYYLTTQGAQKLQTLADGPARPVYQDIGRKLGADATRPYAGGDPLPSTGWAPEFEDVNNDGFIDIFVAKGNVDDQPDFASRDPSNLLLGQAGGTFVEGGETAGIARFDHARGAALADLNLDGLLDLVVVNVGEPVRVWRNVGTGTAETPAAIGHWLALQLDEPGPNRDAIGSWIEVRTGDSTSRREITIGGGHVGGQLGWIHVGLGEATNAEVRVEWPDGETGPWLAVGADTFGTIRRGPDRIDPWRPPG